MGCWTRSLPLCRDELFPPPTPPCSIFSPLWTPGAVKPQVLSKVEVQQSFSVKDIMGDASVLCRFSSSFVNSTRFWIISGQKPSIPKTFFDGSLFLDTSESPEGRHNPSWIDLGVDRWWGKKATLESDGISHMGIEALEPL